MESVAPAHDQQDALMGMVRELVQGHRELMREHRQLQAAFRELREVVHAPKRRA